MTESGLLYGENWTTRMSENGLLYFTSYTIIKCPTYYPPKTTAELKQWGCTPAVVTREPAEVGIEEIVRDALNFEKSDTEVGISMKRIKPKKLIISLIILLIFLVIVFPRLGKWLIAEDEIVKSDIIVVLMGSVPDRILEAVDLYYDGFADQIAMVNSHMVGYNILFSRGVKLPGNAQLSKSAASSLGIQDEDILILDGDAKSTQDEAIIVKDYLKDKENIDSIILVTSKYHSARAKKIFVKALDGLNRDIVVTSIPSKYDTYNSEQWWRNREDVKKVIFEYLKLFNFYTREQFQL